MFSVSNWPHAATSRPKCIEETHATLLDRGGRSEPVFTALSKVLNVENGDWRGGASHGRKSFLYCLVVTQSVSLI